MKVYKLTNKNGYIKNKTKWSENVAHSVAGDLMPCSNGIHSYSDPLLAVLHNPIHEQFDLQTATLWECEASEEHLDDNGLKSCHRWLKTIRQIPIPEVTLTQRIAYVILCAKKVYNNRKWTRWALRWLSGEDRSAKSADAAADAADAAAWSAAHVAAHVAAYAAAYAAADTNYNYVAAYAAADAASRAAANKTLDLPKIAKKAMKYN